MSLIQRESNQNMRKKAKAKIIFPKMSSVKKQVPECRSYGAK